MKMVIDLDAQLGNKWFKIACHLLGRINNEIRTIRILTSRKTMEWGVDPLTYKPLSITEEHPKQPTKHDFRSQVTDKTKEPETCFNIHNKLSKGRRPNANDDDEPMKF
ncbi:hypothetical protein J1N35_041916 [Gossypium stocksii]|uniref:Uncharacterized protein n=1 Tax=Gossypium stocksii TaxID=47602 RepID=A0A9D3UGU3_9ROSI|nr:hypothetical protein J1N35_041916 [Gossypium stocksii]